MADISTAIELYDRVSAPAYNMVAALSKVCTTFEFVELSINKGFDTSAIIQAGRVIEQTETQVIELGN
ncbi:MAG: hypothetical protein K2G22_01685, partial [Eubacterium sp.]|nr:hypothetical protein [Eubacterium sp.]